VNTEPFPGSLATVTSPLPRWYAVRDLLVKVGAIRCIQPGGRGPNDPPIYGWGTRGL
jgi:hypothetical protein